MAVVRREEEGYVPQINVNDVHTILGPESAFEGKLTFEGTVRIDGHFTGEVNTENILVVGQGARVEANIHVGSIVINGEVIGDIKARHSVEINAPGKVRGNITTPQLSIARGVIFEGSCHMEEAATRAHGSPNVTMLPRKDAEF
jgi:cytoskeletal protein CcmA (bactofilin family)